MLIFQAPVCARAILYAFSISAQMQCQWHLHPIGLYRKYVCSLYDPTFPTVEEEDRKYFLVKAGVGRRLGYFSGFLADHKNPAHKKLLTHNN